MPFTGIASPAQIRVMTEVLGIYCRERGIMNEEERGHVAETIVSLFFSGHTTTESLLAALHTGNLTLRPLPAGDNDSHA
jgi:hypothetical protein